MEVSRRFLCIHLTLQVNGPANNWSLDFVCLPAKKMKDPLGSCDCLKSLCVVVCREGNTEGNGRGTLLISCLFKLSFVEWSWMCLGYIIDVLARALAWVGGEGFKVQRETQGAGDCPYTDLHWSCLSWSSAPLSFGSLRFLHRSPMNKQMHLPSYRGVKVSVWSWWCGLGNWALYVMCL